MRSWRSFRGWKCMQTFSNKILVFHPSRTLPHFQNFGHTVTELWGLYFYCESPFCSLFVMKQSEEYLTQYYVLSIYTTYTIDSLTDREKSDPHATHAFWRMQKSVGLLAAETPCISRLSMHSTENHDHRRLQWQAVVKLNCNDHHIISDLACTRLKRESVLQMCKQIHRVQVSRKLVLYLSSL